MRTRVTRALTGAVLALLLLPAPAVAEPVAEDTPVVAAEREGDKHQFPLDLETPYGIFGLFLIICLAAAGIFGLVTAVKNLRGERPQADGSWRWR
jgi:hypothetical protein